VESDVEEEKRLRSAALQNATAILLARQRAERELVAANEALERKTEELREQGEWFRVTLGSIGDAVITVDTDARITFLNPVAEALTGWARAAAVGEPVDAVLRLVEEATGKTAANPVHRALREGITVGLANHTTLVRRDGSELPVEDSAAPIKNSAGVTIGAVLVFHDVTERRQKELALERSYQAEHAARAVAEQANQAKDEFLAALSHELRTPLTPVLAILSSLREEAAIPEALAEDFETMRRNVELEARLIDDLLDLTRISHGKLHLRYEQVSASRIVQDAINTCLADLKAAGLTLRRELAEPPPTICVDGARVTQILWNLLKNSIKFTPSGGSVTVRSQLQASEAGEALVLQVQDSGIGMEPGQAEHVFEAFAQGDRGIARQFGGLGLGLAISKAIAETHGGTLHGSSDGKGQGSTFTLTLPCAAAEGSAPRGGRSPQALGSESIDAVRGLGQERPLRILLVEDHADTAAVLARLLRRMGHRVVHADTVARALDVADEEMRAGGLDLLMSDLGLPDGSGTDLVKSLSAKYELKAIALSGYGMDSDHEESLAAGFSRHLTKPIDIAVLRGAITELMQD